MGMVDEPLTIRLAPPAPLFFQDMPPRRRTSKDTPAKLAKRMDAFGPIGFVMKFAADDWEW
jgi:hypothetical protein